MSFLAQWLRELELEPDVPMPEELGSMESSADAVLPLLQYAYRCSQSNRQHLTAQVATTNANATVRHGWLSKMPVFTVEWEQIIARVTVASFIETNLNSMAEQAGAWDTTFLGAEYLADHGDTSDLENFARLVRWRFRAAPLQDREMLYIVVPYREPPSTQVMIAYISVRGPRYPVLAGHARAKNLVPSFDLCDHVTDDDGEAALRVQHCMTTEIGGSVPHWVWNNVFKSAVLSQNVVEASHVREHLLRLNGVATANANTDAAGDANRPRQRVVLIGLGDVGVATAVNLASSRAGRSLEIVAISPHACHYSAQELGGRLAQPALWKQVYLQPFESYRMLDRVRIVHGLAESIDTAQRAVSVRRADGSEGSERYDALVICSGCTNGFWRRPPTIQSRGDIEAVLREEQARLAAAPTIAVVGGGPSGVSAAYNLRRRHPGKAVHLFVSGGHILPGYHPATRARIEARLAECGASVHLHHRAVVPDASARDRLGAGPIRWSSGQPPFDAGLVVWAVGAVRPNSDFLPSGMRTADGFVAVDDFLRVRGYEGPTGAVFAVGDVAATDAARTSARNDGWALVAANVAACLAGRPADMRRYAPPAYRWGSILGPWDGSGYEVYFPHGWLFWLPLRAWNLFWPLVQRFLWAGMRNTVDWTSLEGAAAATE